MTISCYVGINGNNGLLSISCVSAFSSEAEVRDRTKMLLLFPFHY